MSAFKTSTYEAASVIIVDYLARWLRKEGLANLLLRIARRPDTGDAEANLAQETACLLIEQFKSRLSALSPDEQADRFHEALDAWSSQVVRLLPEDPCGEVLEPGERSAKLWEKILTGIQAEITAREPVVIEYSKLPPPDLNFDLQAIRRLRPPGSPPPPPNL